MRRELTTGREHARPNEQDALPAESATLPPWGHIPLPGDWHANLIAPCIRSVQRFRLAADALAIGCALPATGRAREALINSALAGDGRLSAGAAKGERAQACANEDRAAPAPACRSRAGGIYQRFPRGLLPIRGLSPIRDACMLGTRNPPGRLHGPVGNDRWDPSTKPAPERLGRQE